MVLYSTLPMLWGQMDGEQSLNDLSRIWLNFPALAGHFWFMYPLIGLYLFIPVISPWLEKVSAKEERFFIGLFLISTCIPFLNRWFGEVWGQCFWNEYHMLWYFSGYLGYLVLAHYIRVHLTWGRSLRLRVGFLLMLVGAAATIWSFYVQAVPGVVHSTPVIEVGWAFCTLNCVALTAGTFCCSAVSAFRSLRASLPKCLNSATACSLCTFSGLACGYRCLSLHWDYPLWLPFR